MPAITVKTLELTEEQKAYLAREYTAAMSEVTGVPPDRIYVFFEGHSLDSIAAGGSLVSENPPGPDDYVVKYTVELKRG